MWLIRNHKPGHWEPREINVEVTAYDESDDVIYGSGEVEENRDPTLALFWAIWEIIEKGAR